MNGGFQQWRGDVYGSVLTVWYIPVTTCWCVSVCVGVRECLWGTEPIASVSAAAVAVTTRRGTNLSRSMSREWEPGMVLYVLLFLFDGVCETVAITE